MNITTVLPGVINLMVEITDHTEPQGWLWGAGSPGLLPGLSFMPMNMIGQAVDTNLAFGVVDQADMQLAAEIIDLMSRRLKKRKKTMWALDRDGSVNRLGIYFPNEDARDVFERAVQKLPSWGNNQIIRRSRLFI